MKKTVLTIMTLTLFAATSCHKGPELSSGVNLDNLDTTVNPAEDFYHYACGGWLKAHPLDAEHSRYGAFDVLAETNQEQLRTLIETAAAQRQLSYAPYSGYRVGAALLAADGRIFIKRPPFLSI